MDSRLVIAMLLIVIMFCVVIIFQINSIYNIETEKNNKINTLTEIISDLRYLQKLEEEVIQKIKQQEDYNNSIKELHPELQKSK